MLLGEVGVHGVVVDGVLGVARGEEEGGAAARRAVLELVEVREELGEVEAPREDDARGHEAVQPRRARHVPPRHAARPVRRLVVALDDPVPHLLRARKSRSLVCW